MVSFAFEHTAQLAVVVDFTIEHHCNIPVFIEDWLMPCFQINDTQATNPQANTWRKVKTFVIRTAVQHNIAHPFEKLSRGQNSVSLHNSSNSAHASSQRLTKKPFNG